MTNRPRYLGYFNLAESEDLARQVEEDETITTPDEEPLIPLGDVFDQSRIDNMNSSACLTAAFGRRKVSNTLLIDPRSIGLDPDKNEFVRLFEDEEMPIFIDDDFE